MDAVCVSIKLNKDKISVNFPLLHFHFPLKMTQ